MTKLEEIKTRITERLKRKNFDFQSEIHFYIIGYLNALLDTHEIDSDEYTELFEEFIWLN